MDKVDNLLNRITGKPEYGAVPDNEDDSADESLLGDSDSAQPETKRYFSTKSEDCSVWWIVSIVFGIMSVIFLLFHYKTSAQIGSNGDDGGGRSVRSVDRGASHLHPIAHHLDDLLFESSALNIGPDISGLDILNTDITSLLIDEESYIKEANLDHFGPHSFHVRYPKNKGDEYATDEIRKMCFYFELKQNDYGVNAAQIDLKWNEFKLEPGFDRVVLRHFNETIVYPPESFSRNNHQSDLKSMDRSYSLFAGEHKAICLEFQSDDSVVDQGFDFELNVRYDVCEWKEWDQCFMLNTSMSTGSFKRWGRGPFSNGQCGVGITHKHRTTKEGINIVDEIDGGTISNVEGVVDCTKERSIGPEFCIKAPCGNYDNAHDPDHPCHSYGLDPKAKCWHAPPGRRNMSRLLNGRGRVDPVYPDAFALYLSENRHRPFSEMQQTLDHLKKEIGVKMKTIADTHSDPNVLRFSMQDPEHKNLTADYVGARVLDSLLIGRPFIVDMTGDSVMSGHDSMYMNTIGLQLQSRLREFWVQHGVKGSTFQVRNVAEGGGPTSKRQAPLLAAMTTENHDFFSLTAQRVRDETAKENTAMTEKDDHYRFLSAGAPIYDIDLHGSDNNYCDGGASFADREAHMRYTGFLNGIWMRMANPSGLGKTSGGCQKWEDLVPKMGRWSKEDWRYARYPFVEHYTNETNMSMGIIELNANFGVLGACNFFKEGSEFASDYFGNRVNTTNADAFNDGELPEGKAFGYTSAWLMNNWHPSPRGSRLDSDVAAFWMLESAYNFIDQRADELIATRNYAEFEQYLKRESGDWRSKMMNSIKSGDIQKDASAPLSEDMFPRPVYCGKPNGQCVSGIPFSLTAWAPVSFNTHSKLSDYFMSPVPAGVGWSKGHESPLRPALEKKTGGPAWMDDKAWWQCDGGFYYSKFEQFAKGKKGGKLDLEHLPQSQMEDLQRQFHADLIQKKMYLQLGVKVPLYGNGTVRLSKWGGSWTDDKKSGRNGTEQAIAYLAKIDDKTIGVPSSDRDKNGAMISWHGLNPGQKYKLSIVPYKIGQRSDIRFSNIVAF